ncbi:37062_t:CDS:2, partial [Racocetra persica]
HCNRSEMTNHSFNSSFISMNPLVIISSLSENELGSDDIEESELGLYCFEKNELELDNSEETGEQKSLFFTAFNSLKNNDLRELEHIFSSPINNEKLYSLYKEHKYDKLRTKYRIVIGSQYANRKEDISRNNYSIL